jgi:hypothetical protein
MMAVIMIDITSTLTAKIGGKTAAEDTGGKRNPRRTADCYG